MKATSPSFRLKCYLTTVLPSLESTSSEAPDDTRKRDRKTPFYLADEEEKEVSGWAHAGNPIKLTDYRRTYKKNKLWEEQAVKLSKTADYLKGWFKSLRDNTTRLDKNESGDGAPKTDREGVVGEGHFQFYESCDK